MKNLVEIYFKPTCPYCMKAKRLLDLKSVTCKEYNIAGKDDVRAEMIERAHGRTTVPQIFINGEHIGGCDDLHALEEKGELDRKLNA